MLGNLVHILTLHSQRRSKLTTWPPLDRSRYHIVMSSAEKKNKAAITAQQAAKRLRPFVLTYALVSAPGLLRLLSKSKEPIRCVFETSMHPVLRLKLTLQEASRVCPPAHPPPTHIYPQTSSLPCTSSTLLPICPSTHPPGPSIC